MADVDVNAIATNLATRYAALIAPAGEESIREATANPPETVTKTPYVLVTVAQTDEAFFDYGGGLRSGKIPFQVDFFMDKASDLARTEIRLRKWIPILLNATLVGVHLDLPALVAACWTTAFQVGDLEYADEKWSGISLSVMVQTSDGISPTA